MNAAKQTNCLEPSGSVVPLGTTISPYGVVSGVTNQEGERYYFLTGDLEEVSLMPASLIEKLYSQNAQALASEGLPAAPCSLPNDQKPLNE